MDTPHRLAFVTCDGNAVLLVVELRTMQILSTQSVGADPDVLAFDHVWQRLHVAAESGVLSVFEEHGGTVRKVAEGFVANEAHSVAVDEQTHRLYLPLEDVAGKPVLRIALLPQSFPAASTQDSRPGVVFGNKSRSARYRRHLSLLCRASSLLPASSTMNCSHHHPLQEDT